MDGSRTSHPAEAPAREIPVLDLGPYLAGERGAVERVAVELRRASERVGFYFIRNHGVDQALIDAVFAEAKRFHGQPLEKKQKLKVNEHMIGYMGMGASTTRSSTLATGNKPNQVEAFFVKRQLAPDDPDAAKPFRGLNQWPDDLPGFKETVLRYWTTMEALVKRMLPVYAAALDLAPDFFAKAFRRPMCSLRMSHYPARDYGESEYGIAPHTDSSFVTLLAQNRVQGLQIRNTADEWIDAPPVEGSFLVNTGDMLHRWTNHRFLSTPHRAYNRTGGPRYAIPFFAHPDHDFAMDCLPTCTGPGNPPRYPPQTPVEYMTWFAGRNYDNFREKMGIRD
jgi:isopenicillin N synthase-like dioxygenase